MVLGLQEAAATQFDKLVSPKYNNTSENDDLASKKAWRGVRVVHGAALEKRSPFVTERGFESHPLRQKRRL